MLGTMRARVMLLAMALLAGVAADTPYRPDKDLIAILNAAREYRPEGSAVAQVQMNRTKDVAYVRYTARKDGKDIAAAVLTIKKTTMGWIVESCAR